MNSRENNLIDQQMFPSSRMNTNEEEAPKNFYTEIELLATYNQDQDEINYAFVGS